MEIRAGSTGFTQKIDNFRDTTPDFNPQSGDHLWVIVGVWRCNPEKLAAGERALLDHENLLSVTAPGCFHCEKPYTELMLTRRCRGHG